MFKSMQEMFFYNTTSVWFIRHFAWPKGHMIDKPWSAGSPQYYFLILIKNGSAFSGLKQIMR